MDLASTPVIKTDQTRSNPGAATAALLKNVPTQQGRFITSLQQSAPASLSSVTPSSGISQASVTKQAMNSVSRLSAHPVHSPASSTYHVPRGAAAVANIAVPRTSLATPIRGSSANLQALGVAAPNNSTMIRGTVSHTVGVRSSTGTTLHVASGGATSSSSSSSSTWLSNNSSSNPSSTSSSSSLTTPRPPHPPPPSSGPTTTLAAHFTRASPIGVTRLGTPMTPGRVMTESLSRPVLLQSTTHKQININQSQQAQMHINDKTFLKTGVSMGVRPQTTVVTSAVAATNRNASSLNRIGGATPTLPAVVSLQPTVLVQTPPVPLKTQQPSHTPKFLAQSSHLQMQSLSVNSVTPSSTIAMTTVSKPLSFSTTSTMAGIATSTPRPTLHNINTSCPPTSKVLPPSSSESSVFIQTAHKPPTASVTAPNVGASSSSSNIVGGGTSSAVGVAGGPQVGFHLESVQPPRAATNFASAAPSTPSAQPPSSTTLAHTHTPIICRPASSIVTNSQPTVRYNPVMVVDPNRQASLHHFVNNPSSEAAAACNQTGEGSTVPAPPTTVTHTPTKPNASPRPSILRKRESEGTPLKAQKNLTPLLSTLSVSTLPSSPPSPPKRPESSGGSTTISATSSPGLGAGDQDSPPPPPPPHTKQDIQPEPPPLEMSPRKKPRKQQLIGNQMQEPKNEVEMEFISEEKLRKESKEDDSSESVLPKALPKRPNISLLSSYRHTWKSRHHHFLRYTDIKPKEERRPSINEIATQKMVQQKINGWKLYHLGTQMQCLSDLETEVLEKLTDMLKVLERKPGKDLDKDINRVNELIKGNIQRCKVIKDQMQEAKTQVMKIFDHKGHVIEILSRCSSKRSVKKRDRM